MSEQRTATKIALNVTRTRVTVLMLNLTVIALVLSIMASRGSIAEQAMAANLATVVALFVGFCLTILGLIWLLTSQDFDAAGLSRPVPFALGAITTHLALSQTVAAFMHEYLLNVEAVGAQNPVRLDALGDGPLLVLLAMGGTVWTLTTYAGPLVVLVKGPVRNEWRWVFAGYYFALVVPSYWVHARAFHLQYGVADQPANMLGLYALQFFQPLLWLC